MLTDRVGIVGLWTSSNAELAPVGSLLQGNELVMDMPGAIRPDRGLPRLAAVGSSDYRSQALDLWDGYPVAWWRYNSGSNGLVTYYDGGWQTIPAYRDVLPPATGIHPHMVVMGGALYITSSYGMQFVDRRDPNALATSGDGDWGTLRAAGVFRALDPRASVAGTSGFLAVNRSVAYRTVFGYNDALGRVHLGAPSQREVVINPPAITVASGSLTRTGGTTVTGTTLTAHGFYVGQTVTVSPGEANFAAGNKTITAVTPLTFTYAEAGANVSSGTNEIFTPTSGNVALTVPIPALDVGGGSMTAGYWFAQVHRTTSASDASTDPGDTMQQVYEHILTTAEMVAGSFSFTDNVGDGGRGVTLYTNRYEEGIQNENDPPPLARAVGVFHDHAFYGDVVRKQQLILKLIGVGSPSGVQIGDVIQVHHQTYTGAAAESGSSFQVYTAGTLSQNIEKTARSLVRVINTQGGGIYRAVYLSGPDDEPGRILIEEGSINRQSTSTGHVTALTAFARSAAGVPRGEAWAPALPNGYNATSVARVASTVTVTTGVNHPFAVNQRVWIGYEPQATPNAAFETGWITVASVPAANQFTYTSAGTATTDISGLYYASTRRLDEIAADDSASKGAVEISKVGEHDAVPQVNRWYPGSPDARVLCFAELENRWYVFKEDGVWRLTGSTVDDFDWEPAFPSYRLLGRDTLQRLGSVLLGVTDRGVVPITPGGMGEPISAPVDNLLPTRSADDRTFLAQKAWAYSNPQEQTYVLYALASSGTSGTPDPTGALVWNAKAGGWTTTTRHPLAAGIVDQATGYLYAAEAGSNWTRRDLRVGNANDGWSWRDFHDGSVAVTVTSVGTASNGGVAIQVSGGADPTVNGVAVRVGDILAQSGTGAVGRVLVGGDGTGGFTVTSGSGVPFSNGAATLYRGYNATIQWLRFTGEQRGWHQFSEAILNFGESGFGDVYPADIPTTDTTQISYGPGYLTFATDAAALNTEFTYVQGLASYSSVQNPVTPLDARFEVPNSYQKAPGISALFSIQLGLARWQLNGITFKHRFISSRIP